jgi:hypothetical protein
MAAPRVVFVGERYGRLTVTQQRSPGEKDVHVRCDCGTAKTVPFKNLGRSTNSCGCLHVEQLVARSTKHGHAVGKPTSTYMTWQDMVGRCTNPSHKRWDDYGGRGITICERWRKFENFLTDMGERPGRLTLDRIDNSRGYEPSNCRWTTQSEQNRNRRPSTYAGTVRDALTGRFLPKEEVV